MSVGSMVWEAEMGKGGGIFFCFAEGVKARGSHMRSASREERRAWGWNKGSKKMMAREGTVRTLWIPGHCICFQQAALQPANGAKHFRDKYGLLFSCSVMSNSLRPHETAAHQASLSFTSSLSLLKLMFTASVRNHVGLAGGLGEVPSVS